MNYGSRTMWKNGVLLPTYPTFVSKNDIQFIGETKREIRVLDPNYRMEPRYTTSFSCIPCYSPPFSPSTFGAQFTCTS
ncbi:hypothetical protein C923_04313 [Plasmodium falciparum UGT5.1]|uniref:Uncharacterized protein n=1 Tax=Plasmodium falciparum UGT5.1 TaxID=1237627 RepID=W7JJF3_PLAFA|nr:hypothetical protein C923_04313 [Plasmodium falciparum UGT5.1]